MTKGCSICKFRWLGSIDKNIKFVKFYCAKRGDVRRKDMPVIGDDKALKVAPGCRDFKK